VPRELLYLSRQDVESVGLGMGEIIDLVGFALSERAYGRVEMPPKPGVHPYPGALLHAMPAYVERSHACGIKWVSAFPSNKARGLPNIAGLIVLNDPETGLPEAIMDATWITAARTGASTAVAARVFAREDSEVMGLLGAGVQGRTNLAALKHVLPCLGVVRNYGPHRQTLDRYKEEMEREHKIRVEPTATPEAAVRGADVVITAVPWPSPSPSIKPEWLEPGVFACALDFDASFTPAAVSSFDRRVCDDTATLEYYRGKGYFVGWPDAEELSAVVVGKRLGRQLRGERALSVNLGLGMYDVVVAQRVFERARERAIGRVLPL
jgi:ornithine cyclodeaminase/alanine dehydrogenase-like protein (mu-crystallin family)